MQSGQLNLYWWVTWKSINFDIFLKTSIFSFSVLYKQICIHKGYTLFSGESFTTYYERSFIIILNIFANKMLQELRNIIQTKLWNLNTDHHLNNVHCFKIYLQIYFSQNYFGGNVLTDKSLTSHKLTSSNSISGIQS